jgi:hypothetical protein
MDWTDLTRLEPRLIGLRASIQRIGRQRAEAPGYCANATWYGDMPSPWSLKERLCRLVGWERKNGPAQLRTPEAYDVAYDTLYAALPDCAPGCRCL